MLYIKLTQSSLPPLELKIEESIIEVSRHLVFLKSKERLFLSECLDYLGATFLTMGLWVLGSINSKGAVLEQVGTSSDRWQRVLSTTLYKLA